jgi:tripartite-type tricarboxylate transporter receptor subunit TctC
MMKSNKTVATLICLLAFAAGDCAAQFPGRAIRIVVPVPPGASLDMLARTIAGRLSPRLGQSVVVENQPGAGGNLAFGTVAKAAPDGYTLLLGWDSLQINVGLYKSLPYQLKSFAPVTLAITTPQVLVANKSLPARDVREFIALAKRQRGKVTMGSPGSGSPGHLAGALFMLLTGTELIHVPYKGGAPAAIDVLAGHIDVLFVSLPAVIQYVRSGKLHALGVSTPKRAPSLPDVPTFAQAGVKGYELVSWQGILAPAGTPPEIIDLLNAEIVQVLRSAEVRDVLVPQGYEIVASTPAALDAELKLGTEKWLQLIRKSGATAD